MHIIVHPSHPACWRLLPCLTNSYLESADFVTRINHKIAPSFRSNKIPRAVVRWLCLATIGVLCAALYYFVSFFISSLETVKFNNLYASFDGGNFGKAWIVYLGCFATPVSPSLIQNSLLICIFIDPILSCVPYAHHVNIAKRSWYLVANFSSDYSYF